MKDKSSFLLFLCAIAVAFAGCFGAPTIWDGQWRLNELKSHYAGPTFSVAISPAGEYRVDSEAFAYSFRCDGKDSPTPAAQTPSCTQINPRAIALKAKVSGGPSNTRWDLSADGKTLTITASRFQLDSSLKDQVRVFERNSGSSGFAGRWRETKPLESLSRTVVLILNYDAFHIEYPDLGQFSDSRVNEPPSPIRGLNETLEFSRSVQILGARQLQTEDSFNGRVIRRTTWKVSDDGKTLYEESWAPENPTQKDLLVYQKW